jgi:acetolactate synthase-1/3 small subunit
MREQLHPISAIVANESGVLSRIAGMFARRGFNIESLAVGITEDPARSRMTIMVRGDEQVLDQVVKQLDRLIDVLQVSDLADDPHVERELALIKINAQSTKRSEVIELAEIFRAKIIDVGSSCLIVEICGDGEKVNACVDMLRPYGILELARTGRIVLARGQRYAKVERSTQHDNENMELTNQ